MNNVGLLVLFNYVDIPKVFSNEYEIIDFCLFDLTHDFSSNYIFFFFFLEQFLPLPDSQTLLVRFLYGIK